MSVFMECYACPARSVMNLDLAARSVTRLACLHMTGTVMSGRRAGRDRNVVGGLLHFVSESLPAGSVGSTD